MFARVQTFHQPTEKLDELATVGRERLAAAEPPGYKGFQYLVDREHGKALLISFWDSEEDLRRLEAGNAATRAQVKAEAGVEPPAAEVFEVALRSL
ncbi:hypothetical protein RVR_9933 [Actinacidiphila reveromycinica]|uniref:ABM domain-containing protein n=1 Tax=Actinacidiphila reveromycinica TaxID=659352 RepID=A0A7U3UXP8_9ACTN|nr:antibiotic biosynthesis monooxygenase [Streptomyces sp. SN-593]BBB02181.1 hypothetical protein RVR_9933 [Streptomyces sp. SN-593]